ncbi:hypothetical protein B296_00004007 [Ensete ventricosum]|uniref:Uncharacterized protein n=1 Tax=Ensete ventricosum TaxID=4639 RepID=A0A427B8X1_ENSVE|nr:hypothetical protein B296_00004007 [Ensete ventricosum]
MVLLSATVGSGFGDANAHLGSRIRKEEVKRGRSFSPYSRNKGYPSGWVCSRCTQRSQTSGDLPTEAEQKNLEEEDTKLIDWMMEEEELGLAYFEGQAAEGRAAIAAGEPEQERILAGVTLRR